MEHLSYFGDCLKDMLDEYNLTIKQLSELTGIKQSRLYDFINKLHAPSLANAVKIADVFHCPLDFMFGLRNDFEPKEYLQYGSVSNRVKAAMDESKISRYQLSKLTGISQPQLLRWYHGLQIPTLVSLITLAERLDCSLDFLAGRDD